MSASLRPRQKSVKGAASGQTGLIGSVLCLFVLLALARSPGRAQVSSGGDEDNARIAAEAEEALRKHDYPRAIESLQRLERAAPKVGEIHANLASAYYSVGRFEDAAEQAREALKLKPSLLNAHFFLGLSLAQSDRCKEAMPFLGKDYARAPDTQLKRLMGTQALRCAMFTNDAGRAVDLVRQLNRDFPDDPDLLYLSSHVYSDLSTQASERLLAVAPESFQAHQLNAEVLVIQGKLNEAAEEFRKVLALNPTLSGIHYQLGELSLAGDRTSNSLDAARQEFAEELKLHPHSAGAEYELGEMARQARQWDEAIDHFNRALSDDPQFTDALIGLGKALVSAGRPEEAVAPLERAVKFEPANANAHYQLSFAYRRLGRGQEAANELAAYREIHDDVRRRSQRIRTGILGNIAQPQTDAPPE